MERDDGSRKDTLKREVYEFKSAELRLRWIASSEFTPEYLKAQAEKDLKSLLRSLRKTEMELSWLEKDLRT